MNNPNLYEALLLLRSVDFTMGHVGKSNDYSNKLLHVHLDMLAMIWSFDVKLDPKVETAIARAGVQAAKICLDKMMIEIANA